VYHEWRHLTGRSDRPLRTSAADGFAAYFENFE
jgi:hypothetical protein